MKLQRYEFSTKCTFRLYGSTLTLISGRFYIIVLGLLSLIVNKPEQIKVQQKSESTKGVNRHQNIS